MGTSVVSDSGGSGCVGVIIGVPGPGRHSAQQARLMRGACQHIELPKGDHAALNLRATTCVQVCACKWEDWSVCVVEPPTPWQPGEAAS